MVVGYQGTRIQGGEVMKIRIVKPDAKFLQRIIPETYSKTQVDYSQVYDHADTIEVDIDEMINSWYHRNIGSQGVKIKPISFSEYLLE